MELMVLIMVLIINFVIPFTRFSTFVSREEDEKRLIFDENFIFWYFSTVYFQNLNSMII